jgi:hypothetical protein
MSLDFTQRLHDLTDNIAKDNALLKEYEDALRSEDDPRRKSRYRQEIEYFKDSARAYKQEYKELEKQAAGEQLVEVHALADQLQQMNSKLNLVLNGQVEIHRDLSETRKALLSRYDESERVLIGVFTQQLNQSQLVLTQALFTALESEQLSESEMQQMIKLLVLRIPTPSMSQTNVLKILKDTELDARHKLKISIPIIPFLVDYEGELELGTSFDFQTAWEWIEAKLRRR